MTKTSVTKILCRILVTSGGCRQAANGVATVRGADGELFTRATGTFLLHRRAENGSA
jgi:hypothetical protein